MLMIIVFYYVSNYSSVYVYMWCKSVCVVGARGLAKSQHLPLLGKAKLFAFFLSSAQNMFLFNLLTSFVRQMTWGKVLRALGLI